MTRPIPYRFARDEEAALRRARDGWARCAGVAVVMLWLVVVLT
ncbi:hypothetical protein [Jannaschia sp. M317]|nr:hypothetical protein [Jannaschia sp. M317]